MKHLSIKKRVTIWYAIMLVVLLSGIILALFAIDDRLAHENLKSSLTQTVDQSLSDVKITDGVLTIDQNIDTYIDGKSIIVAREDGFVITGLYPDDSLEKVKFIADKVRLVNDYYIYDRKIENEKAGIFWVRGVTPATVKEVNPLFDKQNSWILIIALAIGAFGAVLGGYYVTYRAFRPLGKINDTANRIQAGHDLSTRIELPQELKDSNSDDEIFRTAKTFDNMLDRLEESFLNEKQFTNDASHELRTPTAVIMAASEYALGNLDDRDEVEESLQTISDQSHKISSLLEKLLMFARADRGVLVVNKEDFCLSDMLDALVGIMSAKATDCGITLNASIDKDIMISADQPLLERMFENLIGNALTYTDSGGDLYVSLTVETSAGAGSATDPIGATGYNGVHGACSSSEDGSCSRIVARISDTGIGIAKEDLPKIWNRFYRVDSARTASDGNNMGLGLPVVKWIADQHNIEIEVQSEPGVGTEFILRF